MRTLLILRHAKSSWDNPADTDYERPLNHRGRKTAPRIGTLLHDEELIPDLIVSSTAVRARTTAEMVAESCGFDGPIQLAESLYQASPSTHLRTLREISEAYSRVLLVAHNPGLEGLLTELTGVSERLPTAALAQVDLDIADWGELDASGQEQLVHLWRPKEMD